MYTECRSENLKGRNHVEDIRRWEEAVMLDVQRDRMGGCGCRPPSTSGFPKRRGTE
jgi:hypothetical protein